LAVPIEPTPNNVHPLARMKLNSLYKWDLSKSVKNVNVKCKVKTMMTPGFQLDLEQLPHIHARQQLSQSILLPFVCVFACLEIEDF